MQFYEIKSVLNVLIFTTVPKHDSWSASTEDNVYKTFSIGALWHKYNKYKCCNITM